MAKKNTSNNADETISQSAKDIHSANHRGATHNSEAGTTSVQELQQMTQLTLGHSLALAMQNLVAQQQHALTLLNALTSAAAKAVLTGQREEAETLIRIGHDLLAPQKYTQYIQQLAVLSIQLNKECGSSELETLDQILSQFHQTGSHTQSET